MSPGESGETCTRQILTFMCNNRRNKGKELILINLKIAKLVPLYSTVICTC